MSDQATIRVFISSPADVRPERLKAEQIVRRLNREFSSHFHVEPVLWERRPLVATHHFQDPENIPEPRRTDIVVVILWSRLGLPLPADKFRGAVSGRCPVTGTEWEFEDALAGAREHDGVPRVLVYRKTAVAVGELTDREVELRLKQIHLVKDFFARWFEGADGQSLSAAMRHFATTAEFEDDLYEHLRALLVERTAAKPEGVIHWHEAPFRALLSYEYEQGPIFKGRTRARNELRELLAHQIERGTAFVLVFGASGSGKSSLVKAGLLPDLALLGMIGRVGLVRRAVMRPSDAGADPLAALAAAILSPTALPELAGLQYGTGQLAALLREAPAQAALPIRQGLAEAGKRAEPPLTDSAEARLVIVVDQLEEIFTIDRLNQHDREAFVAALDTLAKSGIVWVVATMRSDFFDRLETPPGLALGRLAANEACYRLLPPNEAEIGQIIRLPAFEAALHFKEDAATGATLDEVIRQAATKDRGALPLLSFLLDQLWQRRADKVLTFAAYREMGELEGAIGSRAEDVFQTQPDAVQKELVPLLRELVTIESGKPVSRTAALSRFAEGTARRALVDAFLDPGARLLVSDGAQLRLTHEALLSHWPRAKGQIAADARDIELRGQLEQEAERWRLAPRHEKKGRLIGGLPLAEARALRERWGIELPEEIREFITASHHQARARRLRVWGSVAASPLVLPLIALVVWATFVRSAVREVENKWATEEQFMRIPAGSVWMGSPDGTQESALKVDHQPPNEGPIREVHVRAFELARYPVTQGEWRRVMIFPNNPTPFTYARDDPKVADRLPAESVTWYEVQRFLWVMNLFGRGHYRLPSEAEIEYATRARTSTLRYWGNSIDDACDYENIADQSLRNQRGGPDDPAAYANCEDGHGANLATVDEYKANPWGLKHMLGNVQMWTEDCFANDYSLLPTDGTPNLAGPCNARSLRGRAWYSTPGDVRTTGRSGQRPGRQSDVVGFRVARTIAP
jgi:formylglycine-generating enzyme required for sulfatase activity/ribose 1,5-bisphosphokinase PhnN